MKWLDAAIPVKPPLRAEDRDGFSFGGRYYEGQVQTTYGRNPVEAIAVEYPAFAEAIRCNPVLSAITNARFSVFSEARFQWQTLRKGRPGDLYGTPELNILEHPWAGGVTGDLLARMLIDADTGGQFYGIRQGDEIVRWRPDWVEIALGEKVDAFGKVIGVEKVGFAYYDGGKYVCKDPAFYLASEVCHFAPYPDPTAPYRGMAWITPAVREIESDNQSTTHKQSYWTHGATPNMVISLPNPMSQDEFSKFVDMAEEKHAGASNAYKTMYLTAGADATVVGGDMKQMDMKAVVGAGETRMAAAAGIHPVILGLSEGMQGSSLNAGNYAAAKRNTVDRTWRPLWRNAAGSLETLVPPPAGSRLWYDDRDIAFLREDVQDRANVQQTSAITIRNLVDAGYSPESVVAAVMGEDMTLLVHSGLFSVQLQEAGAAPTPPAPRSINVDARTEVHPASIDARTDVHFDEGSIRTDIDATTAVLEGAVQVHNDVEVPERSVTVTNEAPEQRATRKRVITDEIGRITAIEEEDI